LHGIGKTVWLGGMPRKNPGEAVEAVPALAEFSPLSHVDERRCMATPPAQQGQAQ